MKSKKIPQALNTGCNYSSTANKYGCSYGQVYAWVRKYKDKGIEDISEGIKDGTISFKKSAKEQDETSYE